MSLSASTPAAKPAPAVPATAGATPVMAQFLEIKARHPDHLLFFRMGDFYELFFDDAVRAAEALDIALTKRGRHEGKDIPMCGVPAERADPYLERLIRKGFKVAVCEQLEDPAEAKKRGAKAVVKRGVVRLVTAGTLTEETLLEARAHNFLAAVARTGGEEAPFGLAWLDLSTGQFCVGEVPARDLAAELARLDASEILLSERLAEAGELAALWADEAQRLTLRPPSVFQSAGAQARLERLFDVATLEGFGAFTRGEIAAAGAIADYVDLTQAGRLPAIRPPRRETAEAQMSIDAATRANLELHRTMGGTREGSLLAALDRTRTPAGARTLAAWLAAPLTGISSIAARHDGVGFLVERADLRAELSGSLAKAPDMARALQRLALGRGGPRDLAALGAGLQCARAIRARLTLADSGAFETLPPILEDAIAPAGEWADALAGEIARALAPELPLLTRDGNFIAKGYHAGLDDERLLRDESRRVIAGLQAGYTEETEVKALKVKHNNVLGYYVEVPAAHGDKLMTAPLNARFIHRQTMANAVRFTTTELGELEAKITAAAARAQAIEAELFADLSQQVLAEADAVAAAAEGLGVLDCLAGLARLAEEDGYTRPEMTDSLAFAVEGGRHPVVETALKTRGAKPFVANDCDLSAPQAVAGGLKLVTGPNMAGKSTFLRQNALIAVMAQAGSFVPAARARLGIVDRLFSRVGAADDLARGRSTFMVEMVETAAILNQAGPRAFVILDEIGRGTATYDGLSIAWAALEHLHETNRCRTLFATHYHELTALAERLERLETLSMAVREYRGDLVFLHEVRPGAADRSYGIQVAKLAGLPLAVVRRAEDILHRLESGETVGLEDLPLFAQDAPREDAATPDPVREKLGAIDPDALTPREALELLYALKALEREDGD